jgi:addiction module RelB/DinJ family antitoxin
MAQVTLHIRMDEELKKSMEEICQELGINLTTAFTIFAKKMVLEKAIPFEVSTVRRNEQLERISAYYEKLQAMGNPDNA